MGTAFLCTPESRYSAKQKELLIRAKGEDTIRTERFDVARGTLQGWGEGIDGRGISNLTSIEDGRLEEELKEDYKNAMKVGEGGDVERIVTWAGTSVGQLKDLSNAEEILRKIEREVEESLRGLNRLVSS